MLKTLDEKTNSGQIIFEQMKSRILDNIIVGSLPIIGSLVELLYPANTTERFVPMYTQKDL